MYAQYMEHLKAVTVQVALELTLVDIIFNRECTCPFTSIFTPAFAARLERFTSTLTPQHRSPKDYASVCFDYFILCI